MMGVRKRFAFGLALAMAALLGPAALSAIAGGGHGRGFGGGGVRLGRGLSGRGMNFQQARGPVYRQTQRHVHRQAPGQGSEQSQVQGSGQSQGSDFGSSVPDEATSLIGGEPAPVPDTPNLGRFLGIGQQAVVDPEGRTGIQVMSVATGSPAHLAGLEPGDVILSANGYATEDVGTLPWLVKSSEPNGALRLTIRNVRNGEIIGRTAQIP